MHDDPTGQSVHSEALPRRGLLEYVPAAHGSWADAPCGQKLPPVHALHAVEPDASWYSPAAQAGHVDWRATAVNVPGAHGELVVDPVAHEEPAGQSVHSEDAPSPLALE